MPITISLPVDPLAAAEHLADLYADGDDEQTAIEEALGELEAGQGCPYTEFSEEFAAHYGTP